MFGFLNSPQDTTATDEVLARLQRRLPHLLAVAAVVHSHKRRAAFLTHHLKAACPLTTPSPSLQAMPHAQKEKR